MQLAVHVKLASEAVLEAARNPASLRPDADQRSTSGSRVCGRSLSAAQIRRIRSR